MYLKEQGEPKTFNAMNGDLFFIPPDKIKQIVYSRKDIIVSTGSACNSKETEISHVLQAINLDEAYAKGTIRISLGKDNDEKQAKYILEQIKNSVV